MKPSFNIQTNFCAGWYANEPVEIFNVSLFKKIGNEIFFTLQIVKFSLSLSISLY
jgi:hypothetical protein